MSDFTVLVFRLFVRIGKETWYGSGAYHEPRDRKQWNQLVVDVASEVFKCPAYPPQGRERLRVRVNAERANIPAVHVEKWMRQLSEIDSGQRERFTWTPDHQTFFEIGGEG